MCTKLKMLCRCIAAAALLLCAGCANETPETAGPQFTFADVRQMALSSAQQPYRPPDTNLPESLNQLDYDAYRAIDFRHQKAIWADAHLPFRLEFFHRGYLYRGRVDVFVIDEGRLRPLKFDPGLFNYGRQKPHGLTKDLGFAGLRVHHLFAGSKNFAECVTFLGASYFRAVGQGGLYGASARGLGIDTGLPDKPEEFPVFSKFWVVRPERDDTSLTLYVLADSPSATGAYRFDIRPDVDTTLDIQVSVFLRKPVQKLAIAPLTSMFFYGEGHRAMIVERIPRPEVHDSDGLLLASGSGEWLWRPLRNPERHQLSVFQVESIKGFGLLQRDRNPAHYLDPRTSMERRPSIWVEPLSPLGRGRVELLELTGKGEGMDNIAAYYVPDGVAAPLAEMPFNYRLHFFSDTRPLHSGMNVVSTRRTQLAPDRAAYDVEFAREIPHNTANPEPVVTAAGGTISNLSLKLQPETGTYLIHFEVSSAKPSTPVEIRAYVRAGKDALSETWSEAWIP